MEGHSKWSCVPLWVSVHEWTLFKPQNFGELSPTQANSNIAVTVWLKNRINYSKCNEKYTVFYKMSVTPRQIIWPRFSNFFDEKKKVGTSLPKIPGDFGRFCCSYLYTFKISADCKNQTYLLSYLCLDIQILWNHNYSCKKFCLYFCKEPTSG